MDRYHTVHAHSIVDGSVTIINEAILEHHLNYDSAVRYATAYSIEKPVEEGKITLIGFSYDKGTLDSAIFRLTSVKADSHIIYSRRSSEEASFTIYAVHPETLVQCEQIIRDIWPEVDAHAKHESKIKFWSALGNGSTYNQRSVLTPSWSDIAINYPHRDDMTYLLSNKYRPSESGKLLLWHGPPGTGKTYAIRSMVWEWREWCRANYIIDPENFFAGHAGYMINVMMDQDDSYQWEDEAPTDRDKWRLVVIEDAGELLSHDAKERSGQGLSRLLNIVDGMLGQGVKIQILITTNEELGKLHPAVTRPGRAAHIKEFEAFTPEEAQEWFDHHDINERVDRPHTLAELYAIKEGREYHARQKVGFGFSS